MENKEEYPEWYVRLMELYEKYKKEKNSVVHKDTQKEEIYSQKQ